MAHIDGQVGCSEEFIENSRGMQLLTCNWFPVNQEPRALIFFCHGYAIDYSTTFKDVASKFAKEGFGVYGIEYEGHGRSGGLIVYDDDFDLLIDDVSSHFTKIADSVNELVERKMEVGLVRRAFRDLETIVKIQLEWYGTSQYTILKDLLWKLYKIKDMKWESKIVLWRINIVLQRKMKQKISQSS